MLGHDEGDEAKDEDIWVEFHAGGPALPGVLEADEDAAVVLEGQPPKRECGASGLAAQRVSAAGVFRCDGSDPNVELRAEMLAEPPPDARCGRAAALFRKELSR